MDLRNKKTRNDGCLSCFYAEIEIHNIIHIGEIKKAICCHPHNLREVYSPIHKQNIKMIDKNISAHWNAHGFCSRYKLREEN